MYLNANNISGKLEIVAEADERENVTIATNMAGGELI